MKKRFVLSLTLAVVVSAQAAAAPCVHRFVSRAERNTQVVTLLTGKYTFQEAQAMAKTAKLEWLDDKGKLRAVQYAPLKVVRPMPVSCDGKESGVVMIATFLSLSAPSKKMVIRFDPKTTVTFEEQAGQ